MIEQSILTGVALLTTIVLHELGHGYSALKMGDHTAEKAGRLTLNPLKHIDPIGLVALYVFRIGWAKPVPINPYNFKNYRSGMIVVSLAGVTVNFILALLSAFCLLRIPMTSLWIYFFQLLFAYNVAFAVFNLLPIPPLDGSRLISTFLPMKTQYQLQKYQRYSYILLVILSLTGLLSKILRPLIQGLSLFILNLVI